LLRFQGRDAEALRVVADTIERINEAADFLDVTRWVVIELAEAAFAANDLQMVRRQLDAVTQRLSPTLAPILHAHVRRFRARLAALENRDDEMVSNAQAAIDAFQQRQMPFWLAVTSLELGEWMVQHGKADGGDRLLADARAAFTELGATPWIERVDAAVHGGGATSADTALPA
jgi:hypothetical protein